MRSLLIIMVVFWTGPLTAVPTYYKDVLPVLQEHCQDCHRPSGLNLGGMRAPMAFTSYEETRAWAPIIRWSVETGRMPPWHASADQRGVFANERSLDEGEIRTIVDWSAGGAPAGDPLEAPPPVEFNGGDEEWSIGEPDLILRMPEPYLVRDRVADEYVNIDVEITRDMLPEPRWIKSVQIRPGSPVVHHVIATPLAGIAPGRDALRYPEGYARLLRGGTTVTFQMHYNKIPGPGTAVLDQTEIAIRFYKTGEEIRHIVQTESLGMYSFRIPAGDPNYSYSTSYTFEKDMQILWLNPHMHLRGKAALYVATLPDGSEKVLLDVPRYDFNWQHAYIYKDPVLVPAGTRVDLTMWWDNSAANLANPDPTREVRFGRPTTAEMGFGWMSMAEARPRRIIVGEALPDDLPVEPPIFGRRP